MNTTSPWAYRYPVLFLAGPMTGHKNFNHPAFNDAAARLRARGYTVRNPAENKRPPTDNWQAFMRDSLTDLLTADAVATILGWQYSKGALIEVQLAKDLGIPARTADQWLLDAAAAQRTIR